MVGGEERKQEGRKEKRGREVYIYIYKDVRKGREKRVSERGWKCDGKRKSENRRVEGKQS